MDEVHEVDILIGSREREKHFEIRIRDDVCELGGVVAGIERNHDAADQSGTEEALHEFDAVRCEQSDVVGAPHAECEQAPGNPDGTVEDLDVGVTASRKDDQVLMRMTVGTAEQKVSDGRHLTPVTLVRHGPHTHAISVER